MTHTRSAKITREAALSYSWVGCTFTRGRRQALREGHPPGQVGRHPVVVAAEKAAYPAHRVAHGYRISPGVHHRRQPLLGEQRDDDHRHDGAEQPPEPDQTAAAEQIARPLVGVQDEIVDLGPEQSADDGTR